jgi:hypothetical protein
MLCSGMDGMNDDEMMKSIADTVGARMVPPNLVRRKRKRTASRKQPVLAATPKGFGGK